MERREDSSSSAMFRTSPAPAPLFRISILISSCQDLLPRLKSRQLSIRPRTIRTTFLTLAASLSVPISRPCRRQLQRRNQSTIFGLVRPRSSETSRPAAPTRHMALKL